MSISSLNLLKSMFSHLPLERLVPPLKSRNSENDVEKSALRVIVTHQSFSIAPSPLYLFSMLYSVRLRYALRCLILPNAHTFLLLVLYTCEPKLALLPNPFFICCFSVESEINFSILFVSAEVMFDCPFALSAKTSNGINLL